MSNFKIENRDRIYFLFEFVTFEKIQNTFYKFWTRPQKCN